MNKGSSLQHVDQINMNVPYWFCRQPSCDWSRPVGSRKALGQVEEHYAKAHFFRVASGPRARIMWVSPMGLVKEAQFEDIT